MYGSLWSASDTVVHLLQFYCLLLLFFAVNGSLEAYFFAVADQRRIRMSLAAQVAAFAVFVIVARLSLPSCGPLAILMGNAASMLLRRSPHLLAS